MADLNANELVVASFGTIRTAPVGTTLPAFNSDPTAALASGFGYGLGFITEDGVTFSSTPDVTDIAAWQALDPVRRLLTGRENMLSFELEQWNEQTVPLVFGGGAVTTSGGFYTYRPPSSTDGLAERSLVLDWNDGSDNYRLVIPRGNVTEGTETKLQRGAPATLSVGFKALAPADGSDVWYLLTNDTAFAVGS